MQQNAFDFPIVTFRRNTLKMFEELLANSSTDHAIYYEQPTGAKFCRGCFRLSASTEFVFV
jgi:hypothetical protein